VSALAREGLQVRAAHTHAHGHDHAEGTQGRALAVAFGLTCAVLVVELLGAWASGSVALAADAGHVLTDVLALGLSVWAARLATRPATGSKTYGFGRAGTLVALFNAALLLLITVGIAVAAVDRLAHPAAVRPSLMLVPALFGLAINLLLVLRLRGHAHHDLNARGAWLHIAGDAGANAAVVVAAGIISLTGWRWCDPALSLGIVALIAAGAWRLAVDAGNVLLEGSPAGLDPDLVAAAMSAVDGVHGVHHLHLWSIGGGRRACSGHLVLGPISLEDGQAIARAVEQALHERFAIDHCTLQIEASADCVQCRP